MEKTIELEIPLLLPGIENKRDECLVRLETSFQNYKGILRAHIERDKVPVDLCLHYDPNLLTLSDVKRLAERAGAQIINRFHHDSISIENMDCSDCARVIEHSLGRMDGVLSVNVNYPAEKMWIEYDNQKINRASIEKRVRSLGYEIPEEVLRRWYKENREILFKLTAQLTLQIPGVFESLTHYFRKLIRCFYRLVMK